MIDDFSLKLAKWLKVNNNRTDVSIDVMKYSLSVVINTLSIIILCVICGLIFDQLERVILVMISFALLRSISGGVHLKSSGLCIIVSSTMILSITGISYYVSNYIQYINIVSLIFVSLFSPSRIENQTRIKKDKHYILKIISIVLVGSNFLLQSPAISIAFLIQSLTLIKFKGGEK